MKLQEKVLSFIQKIFYVISDCFNTYILVLLLINFGLITFDQSVIWKTIILSVILVNFMSGILQAHKFKYISMFKSVSIVGFSVSIFLMLLSVTPGYKLYLIIGFMIYGSLFLLRIVGKRLRYIRLAKPSLAHELGHAFVMLHTSQSKLMEIELFPDENFRGHIRYRGDLEEDSPYIKLMGLSAGAIAEAYMLQETDEFDTATHRKIIYKELLTQDYSDKYTTSLIEMSLNKHILVEMRAEILQILELYRSEFEYEMKKNRRKRYFTVHHLQKHGDKSISAA